MVEAERQVSLAQSHGPQDIRRGNILNKDRANALAADLKDALVDKWTVCDLIHYGKSAAVFEATCGGQIAALKVFDVELVARYGKLTQLARIAREVALADHKHPNLVEIFDGGECARTGHLYIVMEKLAAPSLDLVYTDIARNRIREIIRNVANAAQFLETLNIAHRDIKPANIAVMENKAVLLDLGVIRAIGHPGGSDDPKAQFLGTLQYSPPEFLLRTEEDSIYGWRAVTFYQLGAVLHDLIERSTIFSYALDPYPRLVNAVQHDRPEFSATDVPPDLISLAEKCLVKDPVARLELVSWKDFESTPSQLSSAESARESILQKSGARTAVPPQSDTEYERTRLLRATVDEIRNIIRRVCVSETLLPPIRIQESRMEDTVARFTITFAPNRRFALNVYLSLRFMVKLVDPKTRAITLDACAWLEPEPPNQIVGDNSQQRVFAGFVDSESIGDAVLNYVLPTYERALTLQADVGQEQRPIRLADVQKDGEI